MTREKYIELSRSVAKKTMTEEDYSALEIAIIKKKAVFFTYTDKLGNQKLYKHVRPIEFIMTPTYYKGIKAIEPKLNPIQDSDKSLEGKIPGTAYLWALHELDMEKHSFYTETIKNVNIVPMLIEALLDPTKYRDFWRGAYTRLQTTTVT